MDITDAMVRGIGDYGSIASASLGCIKCPVGRCNQIVEAVGVQACFGNTQAEPDVERPALPTDFALQHCAPNPLCNDRRVCGSRMRQKNEEFLTTKAAHDIGVPY